VAASGVINNMTGESAKGVEVHLVDGDELAGRKQVKLKDEGVYVEDGETLTLYPWHQVRAVKGIKPKKQGAANFV
jgi:hypothetical protein